jgi:hypothetical protein
MAYTDEPLAIVWIPKHLAGLLGKTLLLPGS